MEQLSLYRETKIQHAGEKTSKSNKKHARCSSIESKNKEYFSVVGIVMNDVA